MTSGLQTIPARHGAATFVPAGQSIRIINTSGTQVVDTWAFALPNPETKKGDDGEAGDNQEAEDKEEKIESSGQKQVKGKALGRSLGDLPSQEEAVRSVKEELSKAQPQRKKRKQPSSDTNSWSSYVPSLGSWKSSQTQDQGKQLMEDGDHETTQGSRSKTWASYFPSGIGISSYIPQRANEGMSAFAASHGRDQTKSYLGQIRDFSCTPVGAAGLAAVTGSGASGSLYAAYQAWNSRHVTNPPQMEFLSMPHSRASTLHLQPKINDVLVSNLREPILTLLEDSSNGIHDTLIAACDPYRYRGLGVERWEEHGSCAENLVLTLRELNQKAGLKGANAVGADVTVDSVPAPLNLFMNIPWTKDGSLEMGTPESQPGVYVRFRAEKDVVVVMSACPQDIIGINAGRITDAHFVVEEAPTQVTSKPNATLETKAPSLTKPRLPSGEAPHALDTEVAQGPVKRKPTSPSAKPPGAASSTSPGQRPKRLTSARTTSSKTSAAGSEARPGGAGANVSKAIVESPASATRKRPRKLAVRSTSPDRP